jgi:hypothetical protein
VTWTEFRSAFCAHYIPAGVMRKKCQEFMNLKHGFRSVHDYSKLFNHLARPSGHGREEKGPLRDQSLHQAAGAHGAQHGRDIS